MWQTLMGQADSPSGLKGLFFQLLGLLLVDSPQILRCPEIALG